MSTAGYSAVGGYAAAFCNLPRFFLAMRCALNRRIDFQAPKTHEVFFLVITVVLMLFPITILIVVHFVLVSTATGIIRHCLRRRLLP